MEEELTKAVIGCAIEAHRTLGGCGLMESVYEEALAYELQRASIEFQRQVVLPIKYKNTVLASPLRLDLVVAKRLIVECKATIEYNSIFEAQVLTYLRLADLKVGLVINFGERRLTDGVHRVANGF